MPSASCAVLLWSLLALFTVGSAPTPPTAAEHDLLFDRRNSGPDLDVGQRAVFAKLAASALDHLPVRHAGPVRLSRAVFLGPADGTCGRGRADRLSVAAADRSVFGPSAGRKPARRASDRGLPWLCRGRLDHWRRRQCRVSGRTPAGLRAGAAVRADMVGLFCPVARLGDTPTSSVAVFCIAAAIASGAAASGA